MTLCKRPQLLLGLISVIPFVMPLAVYAEDGLHGTFGIGVGSVRLDQDSPRFDEYGGLSDGRYGLGMLDVKGLRNGLFIDATGSATGTENRRFNLSLGKVNGLRLSLGYDQLPHKISNNAMTPFTGVGSSSLGLPAGFTKGTETAGMTGLAAAMHPVKLTTERTARSVGLDGYLTNRVTFNAGFRREVKQGLAAIGGTVGVNGGVNASSILPKPIDYTTDELRAGVGYLGDLSQWQLDYALSKFTDGFDELVWDNPFKKTGASPLFPGEATNPSTRARMGMEPDNKHQRLTLNGGVNLTQNTRLTAVVEKGVMRQDQMLLAYDYAGTGTAAVPSSTQLPRTSADAEIKLTNALMRLSMRPTSRLGINAETKYYSTENNTPRDLFLKVDNDSTKSAAACSGGQATTSCAEAMWSMPYDYTQRYQQVDGSYYFGAGTTLRLNGKRESIERSYRAVRKTDENTYKAQLNSRIGGAASMTLSYSSAIRKGEYDDAIVFNATHASPYINALASNVRFDNHSAMRQFDIANRERRVLNAMISAALLPSTNLSMILNKRQDGYGESEFGLSSDSQSSVTLDLAHNPMKGMTLYTYATREKLLREQASRRFNGGGVKYTESTDPLRDWGVNHDEDVNTIGLGGSLKMLDDKLKMKLDMMHTASTTDLTFSVPEDSTIRNVTGTPALTDLPNLHSRRNTLNFSGDYAFTSNLSWTLGYIHERMKVDDWSSDGFYPGSTTSKNLLLLSGPVSGYKANLVYTRLNVHW